MKILFLLSEFFYYERLGFLYAVTPVKEKGHDVKVLRPQSMSFAKLIKTISVYRPDVIGYSVATGEHNYFVNLNKKLKKHFNYFSLFGGPHPTFFPELIEEDGVDGVCIGEAEEALLEFVTKLNNKDNITNTANFWIKDGDLIKKNNPREPIIDLDIISFPDRNIIYECDPALKYFYQKMFFASRGCPRKCTFCYNHLLKGIYPKNGMTLRYRSVSNLIDEILEVKNRYPLKFIAFGDDNFIFKPQSWLEAFGELYAKGINIPFACSVSANFINHRNLSILKKTNCYTVNMAFECANEEINNRVIKKGVSNKQFIEASKLIKEYGIKLKTMNIIALPTSDPIAVDLSTLDINIKCRPAHSLASPLIPFPKLEITRYCEENGYLKGNEFQKFKTNPNDRPILNYRSGNITKRITRLHKLFSLTVEFRFLRPFVKILIYLPLDPVYKYLNILWFAYCTQIRLVKNNTLFTKLRMMPAFMKYLYFREKF